MKTVFQNALVYKTDKATFEKANIAEENGIITAISKHRIKADKYVDFTGKYVIPGLVDVHTHGRVGCDFDMITEDEMNRALKSYAEVGTTSVMVTFASTPFEDYFNGISCAKNAETDGIAHVAGIHIEGRYLAESKRGAHATHLLHKPDIAELDRLLDAIAPLPAHVSMAPELDGSEAFIRHAVERGATVAIAHSDATYEKCAEAIAWGADAFTHTFNAMRGIHHREPGTVSASLLADDCYSEFICDGFHINPEVIRLAARVKNPDKLVLITDSLSVAGCPDSECVIGGIPVTVKDGKAINAEGAIAGSTIALIDGLRNFIRFTGIAPEIAVRMATRNPAMMVGAYDEIGELAVGKRCDFIVTSDKITLPLDGVVVGGKIVK